MAYVKWASIGSLVNDAVDGVVAVNDSGRRDSREITKFLPRRNFRDLVAKVISRVRNDNFMLLLENTKISRLLDVLVIV